MTPEEWARVFDAGWNADGLNAHTPAGNALAIALHAMARECDKIAAEKAET
jgi:hypothetical protein